MSYDPSPMRDRINSLAWDKIAEAHDQENPELISAESEYGDAIESGNFSELTDPLDVIEKAYWPAAISGDYRAAAVVLKTQDMQEKKRIREVAEEKLRDSKPVPYDGEVLRLHTKGIIFVLNHEAEILEWIEWRKNNQLLSESDTGTRGCQDPALSGNPNPSLNSSNRDFQL